MLRSIFIGILSLAFQFNCFAISSDTSIRKGKDYALFFATKDYDNSGWTDLRNPIRDAEAVASELRENYSFTIDIHHNPSQTEIYEGIEKYRDADMFQEDSQLLIFFSGHGYYNGKTTEGFIIPSDGRSTSTDSHGNSWIPHSRLREIISSLPCKHIFVIIDACFSGTFDREIILTRSPKPIDDHVKDGLRYKSRLYLTSGGKDYVSDGNDHSPFTRQLLNTLRLNQDGILNFLKVAGDMEFVKPKPVAGTFEGNEPGGNFYFIRNNASVPSDGKRFRRPVTGNDKNGNEKVEDVDSDASQKETISFRVIDRDTRGIIQGAVVVLNIVKYPQRKTNELGVADFEEIPIGDIKISVYKFPEYIPKDLTIRVATGLDNSFTVELEKTKIPKMVVYGRVTNKKGEPLSGVKVSLYVSGESVFAQTDIEGFYHVTIAESRIIDEAEEFKVVVGKKKYKAGAPVRQQLIRNRKSFQIDIEMKLSQPEKALKVFPGGYGAFYKKKWEKITLLPVFVASTWKAADELSAFFQDQKNFNNAITTDEEDMYRSRRDDHLWCALGFLSIDALIYLIDNRWWSDQRTRSNVSFYPQFPKEAEGQIAGVFITF